VRAISRITILVALSLLLTACFGRIQPVYNANQVPVPVALQDSSASKIGTIIQTAAIERGWQVQEETPGKIKATLRNRTHQAVVSITYNNKSYSIDYVSSQDLLYEGGKIHRNYNRWVRNLEVDINKDLNRAALSS
jgi:hypothetical protein